ncbi:hypothetical protein HYX15_01655 [Candidatus Woesearchaeota archaeon]|nr:hypothetical protein [Candidatus Woesearchaeota archaeon]
MHIFLGYRFTGENPEELKVNLRAICSSLEKAGHRIYCSLWEEHFYKENNYTADQIYEHALKKMQDCDAFLALVKSNDRSKGMNKEKEEAVRLNKKIYLAIKRGLDFQDFRNVANEAIEWDNLEELCILLSKLKS